MGWWPQIWRTRAEDWVNGWLEPQQVPRDAPAGPVVENASYLNVFLKSARVVDIQKGFTTFYGAVHSFMRISHRGLGEAEFNVVTTPSALKNVDAAGIDRVIQMNQRLLGPVPYVGGDVEMEVGLFSVASSNLAAPYLGLLESLSKTGGVSFISAAVPFAPAILEGVKLLTSSGKETSLEIGLSMTAVQPRQGYYVVMRAPKGSVKLSDLRLDPQDSRLVSANGQPVAEYPYMVLEVRAASERPDWHAIPELRKSYARIQELYREQSPDTNAALQMFRRVALTCNDLIPADAKAIAEGVAKLYESVAPAGITRSLSPGRARELPDLSAIRIYGNAAAG